MSLTTPDTIRTLQRKLYLKAKAEPNYRFYLLYDKIHRADFLRHAYDLVRANRGAPGVDGVTCAAIEAAGLESWLAGIETDLRTKTYQPQPVRRVMIPKPGGGERPLGIPTIRDRVVQTAAKLVLEPIPRVRLRRPEDRLRGGPRTHCLWLPTGPQRHRCGQGGAPTAVPGVHRCGGRRPVEVFRYDPARRAASLGRGAGRRPSCPAPDQVMAQDTGRGDGPGRTAAHERRQAEHLRHAAGRGDQPIAGQPLHEPLPPALAQPGPRRGLPRSCREL